MNFSQRVYLAAKMIPKGKVTTYSEIAKAISNFGASRAVGNALNKNRSKEVPCHRIVKSDGNIGGFAFGSEAKKNFLEKEGIEITDGKIDLKKFLFVYKKKIE